MKANELEELQEDAHAAYHQGDYSTTINVLERAIEARVIFEVIVGNQSRTILSSCSV